MVGRRQALSRRLVGLEDPIAPPDLGARLAPAVARLDAEALDACRLLTETEGILPALESSHAIARGLELAAERSPEQTVLINLSGRGAQDLEILGREGASRAEGRR